MRVDFQSSLMPIINLEIVMINLSINDNLKWIVPLSGGFKLNADAIWC